MKPISRFSLEKHDGPYEQWPLRSRLFLDDKPTDISLPGYSLLHQFETSDGYILVTDYDCPYEEITNFAFISKQLGLQSCRWLGWMYETFLLERIEWIDDRTFTAFFCGKFCCRLTVRSWGIPYIRPRLKLQLVRSGVHGDSGAHIRKLVNAFVPNAIPSELVPDTALWVVTRYGKKHGGLWVGGAVEITHEGVSFIPNALNEVSHVGLEPVHIPMASIRSVRREFGWLTGIVVVEHSGGQFRFRCFGAKQVASRFRSYLDEA
ncbi:MAG: hypothetical protein ACREIG_08190 [Nitrospiraceae bacterium]